MSWRGAGFAGAFGLLLLAVMQAASQAPTPSPALLVLEKSAHTLAIVNPANLQVVARVPAGPDPHEVIASDDGRLAYISNYGGENSALHTISVVDLATQRALPAIDLGALHSAHGLAFAGGKLYFTAETNKVIGRYDPATRRVDWVLGTGQNRTHMIAVSKSLDQIVTSNVSSGTISIIERVPQPDHGFGPAAASRGRPGGGRKTWIVTDVRAGNGSEGFDVSPDGKEIWVANAQDDTVTIIDIASKKVSATVPISIKGANRLKFTRDGRWVLISGLGGSGESTAGNLAILDAATRKEIKELSLGGGSAGILVAPDDGRAYVSVSASGKVAVVDLNTLKVTGYISVGGHPDGLGWAVRKS